MRIGDLSSDVCSSDLLVDPGAHDIEKLQRILVLAQESRKIKTPANRTNRPVGLRADFIIRQRFLAGPLEWAEIGADISRASAAHAIGIGHDCAASREGRFEERSIDVDAAISPAGYGIKQHMLVDLVIQSYGPARRVALVPDLPCPLPKPQRSAPLAPTNGKKA